MCKTPLTSECQISNCIVSFIMPPSSPPADYPINTTFVVQEKEAFYEVYCPIPGSALSNDVMWMQGTRPLEQSPLIIPFGARLLFASVTAAHQGEYTCTHNGMTISVFIEVLGRLACTLTTLSTSVSFTLSLIHPLSLPLSPS